MSVGPPTVPPVARPPRLPRPSALRRAWVTQRGAWRRSAPLWRWGWGSAVAGIAAQGVLLLLPWRLPAAVTGALAGVVVTGLAVSGASMLRDGRALRRDMARHVRWLDDPAYWEGMVEADRIAPDPLHGEPLARMVADPRHWRADADGCWCLLCDRPRDGADPLCAACGAAGCGLLREPGPPPLEPPLVT